MMAQHSKNIKTELPLEKNPSDIEKEIAETVVHILGYRLDVSWNMFETIFENLKHQLKNIDFHSIEKSSLEKIKLLSSKYKISKMKKKIIR